MDYLLFHSQFSPSSTKLLQQFPNLQEKAISVDSHAMRAYVKKLHIVCVPTLLVLLNNRIIDRIIGFDSILNWLTTTIYRAEQLQTTQVQAVTNEMPLEYEPEQPEDMPVESNHHSMSNSATTSLDDLILEEVPEEHSTPIVQTGMSANTMSVAEALKKERENFEPSTNKKKFP